MLTRHGSSGEEDLRIQTESGTFDFTGNKLIGEISEEITILLQLVALNLSRNNSTVVIILKIGQLKQLQALHLSRNQLSGEIPSTIVCLNLLNYLNLSQNNLSGKIPSGSQLQSFNASAFAGNPALCGLPVAQKCPGDEMTPRPPTNDDNQGNEVIVNECRRWFYTALGNGFGVFFWGVLSALPLKCSWRHAYSRFLDEAGD
ncbi:hypothetical protein SADUNF_Sadunf15G0008100 [Salix dunnii]|uniref:Uncharacterized protein n=1 Tax=Salix dunnii TaxID=1413687 RepID=A0A835MI35_9ROSI|nr:hypothetical protein SADUNF_Sadunf15G0008100 [Salix dunnii]